MNSFDHNAIDIHLPSLASLSQYWPWLILISLILIHSTAYSLSRRLIASWLDDGDRQIFIALPLPWWIHLFVFAASLFITYLLWLIIAHQF